MSTVADHPQPADVAARQPAPQTLTLEQAFLKILTNQETIMAALGMVVARVFGLPLSMPPEQIAMILADLGVTDNGEPPPEAKPNLWLPTR